MKSDLKKNRILSSSSDNALDANATENQNDQNTSLAHSIEHAQLKNKYYNQSKASYKDFVRVLKYIPDNESIQPYDVADFIKQWFRELSEPLIPKIIIERIIEVLDNMHVREGEKSASNNTNTSTKTTSKGQPSLSANENLAPLASGLMPGSMTVGVDRKGIRSSSSKFGLGSELSNSALLATTSQLAVVSDLHLRFWEFLNT